MTKQKQKKLTCFYCRYEITSNTKTLKHVLFKQKKKTICQNCTAKKHKPLNKKLYNNHDVQCTSCSKPVMYNKCLPCSICDHFVHGKCYNLSNTDITKIEEVYNFFICQPCTLEIFPRNAIINDNTQVKKQNKEVRKSKEQCLTCPNMITSIQRYTNKHIIYNGKDYKLCNECSLLGTNVPVKNTAAIEFLDCSICSKEVKYESLFCNLCQHWVHPHCNNIDRISFDKLSNTDEDWFCLPCSHKLFPHHSLAQQNRKQNTVNTKEHEFLTIDKCSMCDKKVTGQETISCSDCRHWVHKKCIGYFKNRGEYQDFLKYYSNRNWNCPACKAEQLPYILLEEREYYMLLLENTAKTAYIDKNDFQNLYINLKNIDFLNTDITMSEETEDNRYLNNIDPDNNYKINDSCSYLVDTNNLKVKTNKQLSMITFNIRSIRTNFENFTYLLNRMNTKIHIICLTETWLGPLDNIEDYKIPGYHLPVQQNREGNKHGGGVITYIHKDINSYKVNKKLSFVDEYNNCLSIEININNKTTTIINTYRSPSQNNTSFLTKLEKTIECIGSRKCYILGDVNYNLINLDKHPETQEYFNMMTAGSFRQLITKPTRITDTTKTLIDHIWTNDLRTNITMISHIIITDITDHLPCFTTVNDHELLLKGYRYVSKRIINDENREKFANRIEKVKYVLPFHLHNPHEDNLQIIYQNYFDHIRRIYNDCFPIITKKVHNKTYSKPWITPDILKLIHKKDSLYCKKKKYNTQTNKKNYKTAKKEVEKAINNEKQFYYKTIMNKESRNIKNYWNAIRLIINRKKSETSACALSNEVLGNHYATVAEKLATKLVKLTDDDIPSTSKHNQNDTIHTTNMNSPLTKETYSFRSITEMEIYTGILKLDSNKGPGTDELDVKSLKMIANTIAPHLQKLFNRSLEEGTYPNIFKVAKCVPIYKGAPLDPSLPVNYRPISILNGINKVFERLLHDQISQYIESSDLLPNFQYGYRKGHNTSQAILDFNDAVTKAIKQKQVTIAVFMDLSKAFDTVDVSILQKKLHSLGLSKQSISLITSYMTERRFCFQENPHQQYKLKYGVPQGSILGPLLFILYIHDMKQITKNNTIIVYADDTTVVISGRNITEAKQHCNDILERFYLYFSRNKLSINASKTKYMVYKPNIKTAENRKRLRDLLTTTIEMNNTKLEEVTSIRFLGVIINKNLTWEDHKKHIYNKISKTIGLLRKCKCFMDVTGRIKMYKTFVQPYFNYAIEVWGHTIRADSDILNKLQSKALRIIFDCLRSGDAWRHNNDRIETITSLYDKATLRQCYKQHMELLPTTFAQTIMPKLNLQQLQNKITRPSLNTMYNYEQHVQDSPFKKQCTRTWNKMPLELKSIPYTLNKTNALQAISTTIKTQKERATQSV